MAGFGSLKLSAKVMQAVEGMGFEEPTPVQESVIPLLLAGKDVVVQAQTGTGKTAAYGIPIAERVDVAQHQVQALVLSPTRELALQVAVQLSEIGRFQRLGVLPVYGGQSYSHQIRGLQRGAQVVVATPGRLLDLLERGSMSLKTARLVVLDEADEMLAMGFLEEVERILEQTPEGRQTALFSATMPQAISRLAKTHLREPERVILTPPRAMTVPTVEHFAYEVPRPFKIEALLRLLDTEDPPLALIFSATKQMAADLTREVQGRGYVAEALHGDMSQVQRENVMRAVRAGRVDLLIATDVAARGLDVPEVSHVINFDIPQDPVRYVHRIGRTGRAGRTGIAMTIVSPREVPLLRVIEKATGARIQMRQVPTVAEAEARERKDIAEEVQALLSGEEWAWFRPLAERLAEEHDPLDVAAAALSKAFKPAAPRREIPKPGPKPVKERPRGKPPVKRAGAKRG